VFIWQTPPEWLMPLVQQERITARSSTHPAVCGSQSLTQAPLWPCRFHVRGLASSGDSVSPIAVIGRLKLSGIRCPASLLSSGLGSNRSM